MKFSAIVEQASELLQQKRRVSYRALKVEFDLTDELLDILKEELTEVQELASDKDGKMLVWIEGESPQADPAQVVLAPSPELPPPAPTAQPEQEALVGERR